MKYLLLVIVIFFSSCATVKVGRIDMGIFSISGFEIIPTIKDQKGRVVRAREVTGIGNSLPEAMDDAFNDAGLKFGETPDSLNQVYLEIKQSPFKKTKFVVKANAIY